MLIVVIAVIVIAIFFFTKSKNTDEPENSFSSTDKINFNVDLTMDLKTCIDNAERNNANALFELGYRLYYAIGVNQDINKAIYYVRRSAEMNEANGKYFYAILYYNLGTQYGIDMPFAEKCMTQTAERSYDMKYIVGETIYKSITEKKPSSLTEDMDIISSSVLALDFLCDCFGSSRLSQPKSVYGDDAKALIKKFIGILEVMITELTDKNGNNISDSEAEKRTYSIISNYLDKYSNKSELLKELGYY